ncbi:LytR C-terminal domain-containing protein [candidate division KSB1 bacterium]|nr:LytR C-terminal domain-containing protein [candidate division KSB1 bacterium]
MKSTSRGKSRRDKKSSWAANLNIRPSTIAIYAIVFFNCVLIISAGTKLFQKVDVSIENRDEQPLKIEVQNGCGVNGIATRITNNLAYLNYQVVGKGNADHWNYEQTILINLGSDKEKSIENLCKDIGIHKNDVYLLREKSDADVRLIIGNDYQSLKIFDVLP